MATLRASKQLRLKNLDQDTLDRITVIQANLEAYKNTGIYHFLRSTEVALQDLIGETVDF